MLTPAEIHNKEFGRKFRGYSEEDVDEFLDEIVADYEEMSRRISQLTDEIETTKLASVQYRSMEKNLQDTLMVAQKTADEVVQSARSRAAEIIKSAEEEYQRRMDDATAKVREQQEKIDEAVRRERKFLIKIKSLLRTELELLDEEGVREAIGRLDEAEDITASPEESPRSSEPSRETARETESESDLDMTLAWPRRFPQGEEVETDARVLAQQRRREREESSLKEAGRHD